MFKEQELITKDQREIEADPALKSIQGKREKLRKKIDIVAFAGL